MPDLGLWNFMASDTGTGGYTGMDMRRRIALAMLARERKFPKTFGEGLSAVGDSIGDVLMQRRLEREAAAEQVKSSALADQIYGPAPTATPPAPAPRAEAEPADTSRSVAATPPVSVVDPGDKNEIDAAADVPAASPTAATGYRAAPAYLQPALDRLIQDPTRRAYLGHLAGREAQSPGEVSSTGATGPFQFIRSTGQQYGLIADGQDKRTDIDASILAANKLTDDNAQVLRNRLGREPSPGELALAHQQGAVTAARMLTGAGNAPARNLAVNNVAPGSDPGAAAQKIMAYYGMPGAASGAAPGAQPGTRDSIASTVAARPPAAPVQVADASANALAYAPSRDVPPDTAAPQPPAQLPQPPPQAQPQQPPPPQQPISPAASVAPRDDITRQLLSPVPMAQPQQFAQAGPAAPQAALPGQRGTATDIQPAPPAAPIAQPAAQPYVPQRPVMPEPPAQPQMSPREIAARRALAARGDDPTVKRAAELAIAEEQAKSKYEQDRAVALYNSKLQHYQSQDTAYQTWLQNADARRRAEETHATAMTKAPLEVSKLQQEIEQGKRPKLEEIDGKYVYDPVSGGYRLPKIVGQDSDAPPQIKKTEYQGNSVKFANQMYDARHDIDAAALTNPKDAVASTIPLVRSYAEGQAFKGAQGAAVRWLMGKLRSESGATINPDEFAREYKAFIPVVGDGPQQIAMKAQARATAEESMMAAAGPGRADIDYHIKQDTKAQQKLADEMADMVKQTGKPIVPGKVYENPDQPGRRRIFDGRRWREF